jgi:uncharacterized protein (DUF2164 family)
MNEGIASRMVDAIVDYMYEEGDGKVSMAEALGILEFVKLQLLQDATEE